MGLYGKYFPTLEKAQSALYRIRKIIKRNGYITYRQYLECCGCSDYSIQNIHAKPGSKYSDPNLVWYNCYDFECGWIDQSSNGYFVWATKYAQKREEKAECTRCCSCCSKAKPLSVAELKQMNGDPVWICFPNSGQSCWMLAYPDQVSHRLGWLDYNDYGEHFIAYRNKPEAQCK